jgi:hypothetical protein
LEDEERQKSEDVLSSSSKHSCSDQVLQSNMSNSHLTTPSRSTDGWKVMHQIEDSNGEFMEPQQQPQLRTHQEENAGEMTCNPSVLEPTISDPSRVKHGACGLCCSEPYCMAKTHGYSWWKFPCGQQTAPAHCSNYVHAFDEVQYSKLHGFLYSIYNLLTNYASTNFPTTK